MNINDRDRFIADIEKLDSHRGKNEDEYKIYLMCADNGKGISVLDGKPLKTFDEWLQVRG